MAVQKHEVGKCSWELVVYTSIAYKQQNYNPYQLKLHHILNKSISFFLSTKSPILNNHK